MTIRVDEIGGDGCVLLLSMNEGSDTTVYDRSGYNNNGTIYGATWTSGVTGSALSFDGVDDYVEVPDSASLYPSDNFTVCFWISIGRINPTYWAYIFDKGRVDFANWWIHQYKNTSKIYCEIGDGTTRQYVHTEDLELNKFYHIAFEKEGEKLKLYLNSELVYTTTLTITWLREEYPLYISAYNGSGSFFNGIIDSVRIYNRALTDEEIQAHYRGARLLPLR